MSASITAIAPAARLLPAMVAAVIARLAAVVRVVVVGVVDTAPARVR